MTRENLVVCETWGQLVSAVVSGGYNLGMKEICRTLRCSRSWANRYITPHLPYVYVSSGYTTESVRLDTTYETPFRKKVPWTVLLADAVKASGYEFDDEDDDNEWTMESNLYNREKFTELIESNMKWSARTKRINMTDFVDDGVVQKAEEQRDEIYNKIRSEAGSDLRARWEADQQYRYVLSEAMTTLKDGVVYQAGRANIPWVSLVDPPAYKQLETISTLRGWGEADETVYRRLHMQGALRGELACADADGVMSSKVYYVPDPEPFVCNNSDALTITWRDWERLCTMF